MNFFMKYKYYGLVLLVLVIIGTLYFYRQKPEVKATNIVKEAVIKEKSVNEQCLVDLKGEVNKPGVYQLACEKTINDLIILAGGLTKEATTNNINLSRRLSDEMVVIISSKKELKAKIIVITKECQTNNYEIASCPEANIITKSETNQKTTDFEQDQVNPPTENTIPSNNTEQGSSLILINIATKEELMTLPGIGESKANNIIAYRNTNGPFKTIEEIMAVSGIGEAIFAQIKTLISI